MELNWRSYKNCNRLRVDAIEWYLLAISHGALVPVATIWLPKTGANADPLIKLGTVTKNLVTIHGERAKEIKGGY